VGVRDPARQRAGHQRLGEHPRPRQRRLRPAARDPSEEHPAVGPEDLRGVL
jgi:hypothetical protein